MWSLLVSYLQPPPQLDRPPHRGPCPTPTHIKPSLCLHCPKNNLNLRIKTKLVTARAGAVYCIVCLVSGSDTRKLYTLTVCICTGKQKLVIYHCDGSCRCRFGVHADIQISFGTVYLEYNFSCRKSFLHSARRSPILIAYVQISNNCLLGKGVF